VVKKGEEPGSNSWWCRLEGWLTEALGRTT